MTWIYKADLHVNEVTLLSQLTNWLHWKKSVGFFFFSLSKHLLQGQIARILYSGISFQNITFCYFTFFFLTGLINFIKRWSNTDHIRGLVLISLILVLLSWALWLPQRKKGKTIKDSLRRPHLSAKDLGEHSFTSSHSQMPFKGVSEP